MAYERESFGVTHGICMETEGEVLATALTTAGTAAAPDATGRNETCWSLGAHTTHLLLADTACEGRSSCVVEGDACECEPPEALADRPWQRVHVPVPMVRRADGEHQVRMSLWSENALRHRAVRHSRCDAARAGASL